MNYSIFDIEADNLLEKVTRIHCLCIKRYIDGRVEHESITDYEQMKKFFREEQVIIGHNIIRYDLPVIEKILGVKYTGRAIDSLALSWYLFPQQEVHGLEEWGEVFQVPKPVIADWKNLTAEEYIHRCQEDVKINDTLFNLQIKYLKELYDSSKDIDRIMGYLSYKMECAAEQEQVRWRLDKELCIANLEKLEAERIVKVQQLEAHMPPSPVYKVVKKPKVMFKKSGVLSEAGTRWVQRLQELNMSPDYDGELRVVAKYEEPNAGSVGQVKSWLFSLGWEPETFNPIKEKNEDGTTSIRKVPQINTKDEGICPSIKKLYAQYPFVEYLEGVGVLKHRIGILKGMLEDVSEDGYLKAEIAGFTNTLRFKHKRPLVNLPTIPNPYWEYVRGVLIAPPGMILCGSDMSSLEDNTKQHYMYYYDPEYVMEMRSYAFDPHCDISVLAKKMSKDEECFYKWHTGKKEGKDYERILREYMNKSLPMELRMRHSVTGKSVLELIALSDEEQGKVMKKLKPIRLKNKKVNFAAVYGAYPPKLAETASIPLYEAKELFNVYWGRNKAVESVADNSITKADSRGQMWLFNPVSQFWYSLRFEKDKFSTLNQGTGVYCFDTWNRNVRRQGIRLCGQFHDEIIFPLFEKDKEEVKEKLKRAIVWTNEELKLNVPLAISMDFGDRYSDIH